MAKYRHRTFEMFDLRAEAVSALTPKSKQIRAESADPGLWTFQHFSTSRLDGVTLVTFKATTTDSEERTSRLGDELTLIARSLVNDSRVVMDFAGREELSMESMEELAKFQTMLQSKGSHLALCNIEPTVHAAFFPNR